MLITAAILLGLGVFFVSYWLIGSMSLSICLGLIVVGSSVVFRKVGKYKKKGVSKYEII